MLFLGLKIFIQFRVRLGFIPKILLFSIPLTFCLFVTVFFRSILFSEISIFTLITLLPMIIKSNRHRKLMQAARRLTQGEPIEFQFKINEGSTCQCQIDVWQEQSFRKIQGGLSVGQLLMEFREWVQMPSEMMGKRSNEIALSKLRQFCLKSISSEDLEVFKGMFQSYFNFKKTQQSILVPVYGVISVNSTTYSSKGKCKSSDIFILMPNLGYESIVIFDLKGHCEGRLVEQQDYKDFRFGKDENFVRSQFLGLFEQLPIAIKEGLLKNIEINVGFLRQMKVIDYSLLLVFRQRGSDKKKYINMMEINEKYEMGMCIIDFLQVYNERKKLENKFKSLFFKQISSVDPETYAKRLIEFMKKVLLMI